MPPPVLVQNLWITLSKAAGAATPLVPIRPGGVASPSMMPMFAAPPNAIPRQVDLSDPPSLSFCAFDNVRLLRFWVPC
jgi:hypothetical protein